MPLYSSAEVDSLRQKSRVLDIAALLTFLAGLTACTVLCTGVTTANAPARQLSVLIVAVLSVWLSVILWLVFALPYRREADHVRRLLSGERSTVRGVLRSVGRPIRIPNSVTIRSVLVETEDGAESLRVDSGKARLLPDIGTAITAETSHDYILTCSPALTEGKTRRSSPDLLRRFLRQLPLLIILLIACVIFWSWIFTFVTDTSFDRKVTLFLNTFQCEERELALTLEKDMPSGIRMVQVRPFSYAMMSGDSIRNADLYIVSAQEAETYREWFAPLPEVFRSAGETLAFDGIPFGMLIASPERQAASSLIVYDRPDAEPGLWYLFFGASSLHVPGNENAADNAALTAARTLLQLP